MRIVIALGGQALLWRPGPMTTEVQARNARIAARAIAPLAAEHSIVVVHGNGPPACLPALQAGSGPGAEPYPLDVLDAGRRAAIGTLADIPAIVAGRAGTSVTPGAETGQATPRTTWNPARRGPRPMAGAG